jgi:serine/threonine protein kinase
MNSSYEFNNLDLLLSDHFVFDTYKIINKIKINCKRGIFDVINKEKEHFFIKFIMKNTIDNDHLEIYKFIQNSNHPNLVKIVDMIIDENFLILILKYIDGFNMATYFMKNNFSKRKRNKIIFKIIETLYFLHKNNILHGDIKPDNIMITKNNIPIIIDFDLSRLCFNYGKCKRPFGTKIYIPPEILNLNKFYLKSDIWSLGISIFNSIIYDVLYDNKYFKYISSKKCIHNKSENIAIIMTKFEKKIKSKIGNLLFNLINLMIINEINLRPTSGEIFRSLKKTSYY